MVLFDEIEKAHPEVRNILLQVLDAGRLTDGQGHIVDFTNTIIIMTSNEGMQDIRRVNAMGFRPPAGEAEEAHKYKEMRSVLTNRLRKTFSPEFLNRVDEIIIFRPLTKEQVKRIVDIMIGELRERMENQDLELEVTDAAKDIVLEEGWDVEFGARHLRRAIQREIENKVAKVILDGECGEGYSILVDGSEGRIITSVITSPAKVVPDVVATDI